MSCIKTLAQHCNSTLEKTIFQSLEDWISDDELLQKTHLYYEKKRVEEKRIREEFLKSILWDIFKQEEVSLEECFRVAREKIDWHIAQLENDVSIKCKEALLNLLVRIPADDRLKPLAFGLLRLPRYGGVSISTVEVMNSLISIYNSNPMPGKFNAQLRRLNVHDFKVVCCFFNVLLMLDKINLVVWDARTVRAIDRTMLHTRNVLFPGQQLPQHTYNVVVTLCCARVATFQGRSTFGHKAIAYDVDQHTFVCSKKKGKKNAEIEHIDDVHIVSVLQEEQDRQRRRIRNQRKDFMSIPCKGQPVLQINLRGFHLVYGNERDKRIRYCHCPQCGSFHVFKWNNFAGSIDAMYRCDECVNRYDLMMHDIYECTYCLARPRTPIDRFTAYKTSLYILHPEVEHANEPYKLLYFCKKHHGYAKPKANQLPKKMLWEYIRQKETQRMIRAATGYFFK